MVAICDHSRSGISIGETFDASLGHYGSLNRWIAGFASRMSAQQGRLMERAYAIASRAAVAVLLTGLELDDVCLQESWLEPVLGTL